jgi:hypothetical protein
MDVGDIERLTLLQNIAEMQQHVEEVEVQVVVLQAIVALQLPAPVEAPPEEQQGQSGHDQESQTSNRYRPHLLHLPPVTLRLPTRLS